jgi:hypothetical protein
MFISIKRGLVASAVAVALIVPSGASAFMRAEIGGPSATHRAPLPTPHTTSSLAPGFQWADAGIGAAVVVLLVVAGSGVALTVRGRTHRQLVR